MNSGKPDPNSADSSDSREKWITIDRLCDAYEAALQEGTVERAPFLAGVPKDWREPLSQELDAIDAAYRDAEETREQTLKVPANEKESRRLPTNSRLAELASLDRDRVWLGRFEIRKRLGTGATGSVWCARDARLARWVALKVPHASRVTSETSAARFQTEARAAAAITHPNVVQVHEVLIEDGLPILIQQWIDGPSLAKYLKDHGPLDFDQAANWLAQIADAVSCAHEHGIVHRDLKPANVMLNKDRPMVLDFGLASYPQFSSGLTSEGTVLGTPAYMSPEQAEGAENSNQPATDIYALGTLLYEMLVGTPPFVGKAREVLQANKTAIPTPPRSRRAAIPRDLETITLRCLAKSPSARYRTAADLRDDLQRFLRREPIRARKVSWAENIWVWARFHPAYALLATGVPLVLALLLGILFLQMRQSQLNERANRLDREKRISEIERQTLVEQRHMIALSRASRELSEGDRSRGLELLRSIPESMRQWEWRLLDRVSHSPSRWINADVDGIERASTIHAFAVSLQRRLLFAACDDGAILRWKLPSDKEFFARDEQQMDSFTKPALLFRSPVSVQAMTISPDQKWLAWVDREGVVTIWDLNENERSQRLQLVKLKRGFAIAFSTDSQRIVVGGGSPATAERAVDENSWLVVLEHNGDGEFIKSAERRWTDRPAITSLAYVDEQQFISTRGRWDAPMGSMGFVEAWQAAPDSLGYGGLIWRGLSMRGLDFDPVQHRIAWCDDVGMAYVKDLSGALSDPPRQFQASRRPAARVRFSPDGQELVVVGDDGNVSRWSVAAVESNQSSAISDSVDDEANGEEGPDGVQLVADPAGIDQSNSATPIRHIRDYHGHESMVRDAVYLSPCRNIGGQPKPDETAFRYCEPFLITGGEDQKVYWWSNQGHDDIEVLNVSDRLLVDAAWVSPRQIAITTSGGRRQRSLYFKAYSLNKHELSLEMRRVRSARDLGVMACPEPSHSEPPIPPRFVICTRSELYLFESGNHEVIASRSVEDPKRAGFSWALMLDSQHAVVSHFHDSKSGKELIRHESLWLYDFRTDAPPQKIVLPAFGGVNVLKVSPCGSRLFGGTRSGHVFSLPLNVSSEGVWNWSDSDLQSWQVSDSAVRDLAFLADQHRLATVNSDGTCTIWSPTLLTLTNQDPQLQDTLTTSFITSVKDPSSPIGASDLLPGNPFLGQRLLVSSSPVTHVTSSRSGDRIVTAGDDRVIRVWDTYSGLELIELQPRKGRVVAIEFSPDDRFLMIAEDNSRIEVIRMQD